MNQLIARLESLGLAKAEALVYLRLVQYPRLNGSQITKYVALPKPSVYLALDKLYQRGLINLIPGKSKLYVAQNPRIALEKLRNEFNDNLDIALTEIERIDHAPEQAEFIHIHGYANFVAQLKDVFAKTTREMYIHSNLNLNQFATELKHLGEQGVRIILYTFGAEQHYDFVCEEYYDADKIVGVGARFLLVADYQECLISSGCDNSDYLTIYTRQPLQVSLVAENIHNAIYWLKLYRERPPFDYPCRLATLAEQDIHISGYAI